MQRQIRQLTSTFASMVTYETGNANDWIARKGCFSLQAALWRMIPEILWSDNEERRRIRGKIATAALLKILQNECGFKLTRVRRQALDSKAGTTLFCNRRWLSPSIPDERKALTVGYDTICSKFPRFAKCPLSKFLDVIQESSSKWNDVTSKVLPNSAHPKMPDKTTIAEMQDNRIPSILPVTPMGVDNLLNPEPSLSAPPQRDTICHRAAFHAIEIPQATATSELERSSASTIPSHPSHQHPADSRPEWGIRSLALAAAFEEGLASHCRDNSELAPPPWLYSAWAAAAAHARDRPRALAWQQGGHAPRLPDIASLKAGAGAGAVMLPPAWCHGHPTWAAQALFHRASALLRSHARGVGW